MKRLKLLSLCCLFFPVLLSAQNVGVGTATPKASFNVAQGQTVLFGQDTIGNGGKLIWIPSKYAMRVGAIGHIPEWNNVYYGDTTAWNYDSIGIFSFAAGFQNKALRGGSIALGINNRAAGQYSVAAGFGNIATGEGSFVGGLGNESTSLYSTTLGVANTTTRNYTGIMGRSNNANSVVSFIIGADNITNGEYAHTYGNYNTANGYKSMCFGSENVSNGNQAVSAGYNLINDSFDAFFCGANNEAIPNADIDSWVATDPLFVIGNGPTPISRKNALVMLKNGKIGVGINTPTGLMHLRYNSSTSNPNLYLEETGSDYARITLKNANPGYWEIGGYAQQLFGDNEDARYNIYYSMFGGNIFTLKGNGDASLAGTLSQNSDMRLKKDIQPMTDVLSKISKLNAYTYHWADSTRDNALQIGFLAQELEQQFPELVFTDDAGIKSVAYGNMVPVLLEAIKEQQIQIDELKARVASK